MNLLGHGIILSMARLCRIKAVLTLHGGDLFEMLTKRASIKHMVARWIVRLPHIITTVNPDLREAVCSLGVKSVRFIPNSLQDFIDYSRICTETPAELSRFVASHRPLIVSVGAMQSNYGIDVLIQSLDLVRDVYPEIGAIVVAFKSTDPIYRARIQRLMSRLSLDSAVMFPSSLPYVPSIVAQADLFVRPTFQDGDSISVREALELRIPVVASQIGFRPPGVILFRPGNIEDLAARIIDALSPYNPHTLLGLSREIDPAKAYMEIYRSLLKM
jgi:glycosyltransferase involved in cell wall biosynthesis